MSWQKKLVLIGCAESSGSTLLSQVLDRHSHIASGREFWFFCHQGLYTDFERYRRIRNVALLTGVGGRPFHERRRFCRKYRSFGLHRSQLSSWLRDSRDFVQFTEQVHASISNYARRPVWIEKTPPNVRLIRHILESFEEARFIHVVRDPRDVVLSLAHKREQRDLLPAAAHWLSSLAAAQPFREHPRVMNVRYEDLCEHPHETVERLCSFIGVPNEDLFGESAKASVLGKGHTNTSWRVAPGAAISKKSVGRHRSVDLNWSFLDGVRLSEAAQRLFHVRDWNAGELARTYDYAVPFGTRAGGASSRSVVPKQISERKARNDMLAPLLQLENSDRYVDLAEYISADPARLPYRPRRRSGKGPRG